MSNTITIDQAGRLVLPKAIRDRFGLQGGSEIEIQTVGDHVELKPVTEESNSDLVEKNGLLVIVSPGPEFSAVEAIAADRNERDKHLVK